MAIVQQVIFKVEGEEYGLDIMKVSVIERYQQPSKIPNTPDYIEGIINLRGEVIPIFSLRKKFHLPETEVDDDTMIIIAKVGEVKIGFVVDSVAEIMNISDENIGEAPSIIKGTRRKYINKVAMLDKRIIILLDADVILNESEEDALRALEEESMVQDFSGDAEVVDQSRADMCDEEGTPISNAEVEAAEIALAIKTDVVDIAEGEVVQEFGVPTN